MRKQLIIQLARMGDLLQSKRLVLSLKKEGEVHIVLDNSLEALARLIFPYAILHPVQANALDPGGSSREIRREIFPKKLRAFAALAALDFASVYNLNYSPLSLSLTGMFEPELVSGYRLERGQSVRSRWCKMAWRWTRERRASPLNLADFWAFFHPDPVSPEEVNPPARGKNPAGPGKRLGFVLSGRAARRSLPPEYLARYIETLFAACKGPAVFLLGSRNEGEAARKVCRLLRPALLQRLEDLSGKTSLTDLYELIASLDLLFTPDTGAMHLAAHAGTPVLACFLSSAWVWETGPYGKGHEILQSAPACAPCLENAPCPHKTACRAPFASPDNPGKPECSGLLKLASGLDDLGADYAVVSGEAGPDLEKARAARRFFLREYLRLPCGNKGIQAYRPGSFPENPADTLLAEQDWMLPDYF
jgi:ADP-heptose:LPS heptosyltransferase